jgi:cytochrome c556
MRKLVLAAGLLSAFAVSAAAEENRTPLELPPGMKEQFLEHMRTHLTSLNDVIQLMSLAKLHDAGELARKEMAVGKGGGFGRYMPPEFREMAFEFHKAADEFARVTGELPEPPDAAAWAKAANGLAQITARCNACHATFRVK